MNPRTLDDLLAFEAIRQLKARYCRYVDTKQWERLEELFIPDARLEGFGSVPDGSNPARFVDGVSKRLGQATTIHHVQAPEIALVGPDTARGIWSMMDHVEFSADQQSSGLPADHGWIGWGYYEEEYIRTNGNWLISYMRLARQRMDELPVDHSQAKPGRHTPNSGWL
jgi:hypothetical protein